MRHWCDLCRSSVVSDQATESSGINNTGEVYAVANTLAHIGLSGICDPLVFRNSPSLPHSGEGADCRCVVMATLTRLVFCRRHVALAPTYPASITTSSSVPLDPTWGYSLHIWDCHILSSVFPTKPIMQVIKRAKHTIMCEIFISFF